MKYKRARLIRDLVEDLSRSNVDSYYRAAIVHDNPNEDNYSVHLFSPYGITWPLCELAALATSIERIASGVIVRIDFYDKGIKEPDMVQSIRIH